MPHKKRYVPLHHNNSSSVNNCIHVIVFL